MSYKLVKKYVLTFLAAVLPLLSFGQVAKHGRILSFETELLPSFVSAVNSTVSISQLHYKDGENSLKWNFHEGGELVISKDLGFEEKDPSGKDTYLSTFVVWVYNAHPADTHIEFGFYKDGRLCASFPFGVNFKGWRGAWVSYERDMSGTPEEGMDGLRIKAPQDMSGELFFDQIVTASKTDHRYHTPDVQAPFVNKDTDSHWLLLLKNLNTKPDMPLEELTAGQKEDIRMLEKRLRELIYSPAGFTAKDLESIRNEYGKYGIKYVGGEVSGLPLFYGRANEIFERLVPEWKEVYYKEGMELGNYFTLMYRIAAGYHNARDKAYRDELKEMFLAMYEHACDQGVAHGSGLGNITHYGYSFRNIYPAYYLMKDVLKEAGYAEDAEKTLQWYATTNEVFIKPAMYGMDMDAFNTTATGRICSILMMDDSPEKVRYIKSFSRWIDNGCMPAPGLEGAFKADGGAFHHRNNYPAYAVGGLEGAADMIYLLSRTSFAVSPEAHRTVKNVLLTMRFYCNEIHFPLSMSGRHPDGRGALNPSLYARLAFAGSPDGADETDRELGAAYLRMTENIGTLKMHPGYTPKPTASFESEMAAKIASAGISPEKTPEGNMALGYGCVSVQRRDNWSAVVRGHSRYLWAAEHYIGANMYGRYLAHGSMQILTAADGEYVTPASSGWVQDGFDWARIPGTTAIRLPVDELKANVLNVDVFSGFEEMLYSDEAFAGGLSHRASNGVFGMKLHEHDKYNGSHRARKSYHFLNGRIVCLGSDIENTNHEYDTETTVFQLAVTDDRQADNYPDDYGDSKRNYWVDHLGTGYYIPAGTDAEHGSRNGSRLKFEKNFPQFSRKQNTGEETSGNWAVLTLNHGKAPKGGSYEYAVVPKTNGEHMRKMAGDTGYSVLQKDRNAHIVMDSESGITSYVLFEPPTRLPEGIIKNADTPCLIMAEQNRRELYLTVCNPDLALYKGASDDIYDENGKRIERSIYSRPWKENESQEMPVVVTLKGRWKTDDTKNCKVLKSDKKETVLLFICRDAASIGVKLRGQGGF